MALEIRDLVAKGYVHVHGQVDRDCSPTIWAKGMDQMVEQQAALKLPMPNHNYLCKVVWDLADKVDKEIEANQSISPRPTRRGPTYDPALDPLANAMRRFDQKQKSAVKKPSGEGENNH